MGRDGENYLRERNPKTVAGRWGLLTGTMANLFFFFLGKGTMANNIGT